MKYKNNLKFALILLVLLLSFSLVSAKSFTIFNSSDESQSYFTVNGTNGNVGVGISNPTTIFQIKNNEWISAMNAAGSAAVNMFKLNANNQIEVGAPLNIGSFEFAEDSGTVTFVDMSVSGTPAASTPERYVFKIDGTNIMTVYAEADSSGGIQNERVGIGTISPTHELTVVGDANITGSIYSGGKLVCLADGTNCQVTSDNFWNITGSNYLINQTNILYLNESKLNATILANDIWVNTSGDTMTGDLTMSGTSANIILGSNYLSGDGDDEGIFINTSGYVGIGTSSPAALLELSGSTMTLIDSMARYENLVMESVAATETGTLVITLPKDFQSTMVQVRIEGFTYTNEALSPDGRWEVLVGGYLASWSSNSWREAHAEIIGNSPFSSVRLAYDGSNPVILLGTTSSSWPYPQVAVTEFIASLYAYDSGWNTDWTIDWITDESGISNIITPTIYFFRDSAGNVGIGTTSPNAKLQIAGNMSISNQIVSTLATGTAPLSVASTTKVTNLNSDLLDGLDSLDFQQDIASTVCTYGIKNISTTGAITCAAAQGNVTGPVSVSDNTVVRFDGTTGKLIQSSAVTIDDNGDISARDISTTYGYYTSTKTSLEHMFSGLGGGSANNIFQVDTYGNVIANSLTLGSATNLDGNFNMLGDAQINGSLTAGSGVIDYSWNSLDFAGDVLFQNNTWFAVDSNGNDLWIDMTTDNWNSKYFLMGIDESENTFEISTNSYDNNYFVMDSSGDISLSQSLNVTGNVISDTDFCIDGGNCLSTVSSADGYIGDTQTHIAGGDLNVSGNDILDLDQLKFESNQIAIGTGTSTGTNSIAIGASNVAVDYGISIGAVNTVAARAIAIGVQTDASGLFSVAIGYDADASGARSVAIGGGSYENGADASGINSLALLELSSASANYAIAIGYNTTASAADSIALGRNTDNAVANSLKVGGEINDVLLDTDLEVTGDINASASSGWIYFGNGGGFYWNSTHSCMVGPDGDLSKAICDVD